MADITNIGSANKKVLEFQSDHGHESVEEEFNLPVLKCGKQRDTPCFGMKKASVFDSENRESNDEQGKLPFLSNKKQTKIKSIKKLNDKIIRDQFNEKAARDQQWLLRSPERLKEKSSLEESLYKSKSESFLPSLNYSRG